MAIDAEFGYEVMASGDNIAVASNRIVEHFVPPEAGRYSGLMGLMGLMFRGLHDCFESGRMRYDQITKFYEISRFLERQVCQLFVSRTPET